MSFNAGILTIEAIGLSITLIDVILVAFVLIMGFVGKSKGFIKIVFSFFGTLAVIIASVLLASAVGGFLANTIGHFVENPITDWMLGIDAEGASVLTQTHNWADAGVRKAFFPLALAALGLPATVSGIITDTGWFDDVLAEAGNAALIDVLPAAFTSIIMTIIAFILLVIVLSIVVAIVKRFFQSLTEYRLFGGINSLLGFVLGLAQAYLIVSIALAAVAFIPIGGFMDAIHQQIDASYVAKFLVENNWIGNWLVSSVL